MTAHGTNDQDARALIYLARRLRDETHGCGKWDEAGIVPVIAEMKNWNLATALEQVLKRATDPEARTPKAMLHTVSSANLPSETPKYGPPPQPDECPKHVGQSRPPFCATCNTEQYRTEDDPEPTSPMARDAALAEARTALVAAKHTEEEADA